VQQDVALADVSVDHMHTALAELLDDAGIEIHDLDFRQERRFLAGDFFQQRAGGPAKTQEKKSVFPRPH